jgi:methionyl-tRNA formyltransferase
VRLLFAGTPATAVPSLRAVLASSHEVVAVLTRPPAPAGRGRALLPSPVHELAAEYGIEVLTPPSPRDPGFLERLDSLAPDCAPIVAYGGLVPREALDVPRRGWVNLHFSLLPAWRGAAPVQHAVLAGDDVTGACTFRLEEGLDTGPVYGLVTEAIRPDDTSGDLLARLAESGAHLLVATLDGIAAGSLVPAPQPPEGVSLAPKITTNDARVDWSRRACGWTGSCAPSAPGPGRRSAARGCWDRCARPDVVDLARGLRAGKREVQVGTGSHAVVLGEVRPAGKRAMPAADWARGVRVTEAEAFA